MYVCMCICVCVCVFGAVVSLSCFVYSACVGFGQLSAQLSSVCLSVCLAVLMEAVHRTKTKPIVALLQASTMVVSYPEPTDLLHKADCGLPETRHINQAKNASLQVSKSWLEAALQTVPCTVQTALV